MLLIARAENQSKEECFWFPDPGEGNDSLGKMVNRRSCRTCAPLRRIDQVGWSHGAITAKQGRQRPPLSFARTFLVQLVFPLVRSFLQIPRLSHRMIAALVAPAVSFC